MNWRIPTVGRPRLQLGAVARNMAVVGGASALGQGAIVVAAPVLARLYDAQSFGLLSVYAALLSVLVTMASLRFDFAIPIAGSAVEALHLLAISVVLGLGASIALTLVILMWGAQLSAALGAVPLAPLLWLLPIALFAASVAQALSSWGVYHRSFPALGRMRATQGMAQVACQVALGSISAGPIGLIVGDIAGRVAGTEQLLRPLLVTLRTTRLAVGTMCSCARAHWSFARVMTGASLLSVLSSQVPFLLIPTLFDLQSSGQYFLAYRVLVLPASLVSAAVSQVFFGETSARREDTRRLHDLAHDASVSLFVFSIPTYMTVLVAGPALIEVVFGSQWRLAGLYAQIMAPGLVLWSVAKPISFLLLVGRRERESLAFTAADLGLTAGALWIGAMFHSLTVGIVVLSAVSVLLNIAALWRFLRVASVRLEELVRPASRIIGLTIPSLALVILVGGSAPGGIAITCAVGWAIAFSLSARFSPETRALLSGSHD